MTAVVVLGTRDGGDASAEAVRTAGTNLARALDQCFEELLVLGEEPLPATPGRFVNASGASEIERLIVALETATCERVLIVWVDALFAVDAPGCRARLEAGEVPLALLLALTAWPVADAVAPGRHAEEPVCALFRPLQVLEAARAVRAAGAALPTLFDRLDTAWIEGADLDAIDPERAGD